LRHAPLDVVRSLPESLRYVLAGGFAAAVNWLVRFPLSTAMPFLPAVLLAAAIGMMVGFVTYRAFVFPGSTRPMPLQIRDFIAVNLSTLVVVTAAAMAIRSLLALFMDLTPAEALAHGLAIGIGALLNFFGHSVLTFKGRPVASSGLATGERRDGP